MLSHAPVNRYIVTEKKTVKNEGVLEITPTYPLKIQNNKLFKRNLILAFSF